MPDQVRAVFKMDERTEHLNYYSTKDRQRTLMTLKFSPVSQSDGRSDGERQVFAEFWEASPAGKIELSTINPDAAMFFKPGTPYLVTFEEINEPAESE